jgi:hypothetical protein
MSGSTTDDTPPPAPPAPGGFDLSQLQQLAQQFMPQPVQQDMTPVHRSVISLLGEALGGKPAYKMSPAGEEVAGNQALMNFGIGLMGASQYSPGQTAFSNLAQGLQGAQRGMIGSEEMQAAQLGAQQDYAQKQQEMRMAALKEAIPLLRMQAAMGMPNPLAGDGKVGPPNTSIAAAGTDPVAALPKDQALAAIVQRESGGKNIPTAILGPDGKPASTASGYYQMLDDTWQTAAQLAGIKNPPPRAMDASKADQDAAASALWDKQGYQPWAASNPAARGVAARTGGTDVASLAPVAPPGGPKALPERSAWIPTKPGAPAAPADDTFFPTAPAVHTSPTLRGPGSPVAAAPSPAPAPDATTVTPPAAPAPQQPTQADQPAAPPGKLTFEQYQAQHPITIDPSTYAVPPPDVSSFEATKQAAAQAYRQAQISGDAAGMSKATAEAIAANKAIIDAPQTAAAKSVELRQAAQKNAMDTQKDNYNAEMQRQAQADIETQKGQQAIELAKVNAGQTYHQKIQEQSAQNAQDSTLKPMATQAMKAHQMNLGLSQLLPVLQDLPPGGGALGSVLDAHPDLAPLFNSAGILNDRQADAVRLVNGLVSSISTEMKPTGLGALREYEWDAFKSQLPSMLSTPAGQQKAVAMLMNMNNRISQESSWMNNYFNRKIPDDTGAAKPGATVPAHNLDTDGAESAQQRMDKELGPIIPSYTGAPSGSGQAQWEQSLPPGKPYYKSWARPDPKNPGQALRDQNGNVVTTRTLEVRPWQ